MSQCAWPCWNKYVNDYNVVNVDDNEEHYDIEFVCLALPEQGCQ